VKGRQRHRLVEVLGLVLLVMVHAASVQQQEGARRVFEPIQGRHPGLRLVWAEAGYTGQWLLDWVAANCAWILEIVSRPEGSQGFVWLPRRWLVEPTFGWLSHYRVLSKD
jgi:putative transposase